MQAHPIISLIGPNTATCTPEIYAFGLQLGDLLIQKGYAIVCGGKGGFMEAACKGARESEAYFRGATIGIIPEEDRSFANPYCDIVIPTGLGFARNKLVVGSGDGIIAVAGGSGTLSEIAFAWQMGMPVLCMTQLGGWSAKLAGTDLDNRHSGLISSAANLKEVEDWLHSL